MLIIGTRLFGDGFAVWYTRDKGIEGPVFGNQDKFIGPFVMFVRFSLIFEKINLPT